MITVPKERIEDYVRRGWWGERSIGEIFIETALRQADAPAVIDPPNRAAICGGEPKHWSWGELLRETGLMLALLHERGLRKDDVIVVQLPNIVELHALYLACAIGGIVISPVPVQYRAHELAHVIEKTRAKVGITVERVGSHRVAAYWREHLGAFGGLQHVLVLDEPGAAPLLTSPQRGEESGSLPLGGRVGVGVGVRPQGLARSASPLGGRVGVGATPAETATALRTHMQGIGLTAHDVLTICWTSGTEARAKGVPRNHNEWLLVGRSVVDAGALRPGARMLIPFPFVNMAGVSTTLGAWLLTGGILHHHHPFDLDVFIAQMREHPIDYTVVAPAVLAMLLKEPQRLQGVDFSRLARIGSGGGPLAGWMIEQAAALWGVEVVNYFGSNEGAALSSAPQDVPDHAQRAAFFPRMGVDGFEWSLSNARKIRTRLVDVDSGQDITEPGRPGELRFWGPTIFSGYYNAPELTARAFDEQGYYCTGDLFEIAGDRRQFYRFAGRHKDIVIRGGMNISCEEVEGLLAGCPEVREVAVVGTPDAVLGERICAVVVARPGAQPTLASLVKFLREDKGVAAFKLPEKLVLLDALPRNPVGKVLKRELRAMLADGEAPLPTSGNSLPRWGRAGVGASGA